MKKGFTIIEMVLVIGVITILLAIIIVSVTDIVKKAKNESIKVELKSLSVLAEQYYEETGSYEEVCTFFTKTIDDIRAKSKDYSSQCFDYKIGRSDSFSCGPSHAWAFGVTLPDGEFWCVDASKFFGKAIDITACECTPAS